MSEERLLVQSHCVDPSRAYYFIVHCGVDRNTGQFDQSRFVSKFEVHPEYYSPTRHNDVAIAYLETPLTYNARLAPISISALHEHPGTIYMYDVVYHFSGIPTELVLTIIDIVDNDVCNDYFESSSSTIRLDEHTNLCGFVSKSSGPPHLPCRPGGNGGILIQGTSQVGSISWGSPCNPNAPETFTKLAPFHGWIQSHLGH